MPHSLNPLVGFSGGEWAPTLDLRIDLPNYRKACRKLRNMVVTKQGGATRRPGTQFIVNGKASQSGQPSTSRGQKFQYAPGTSFWLEFCDLGIRFYSNGVQVQVVSPPAWVTGTSYPAGAFVTNAAVTYYLWNGPLTPSSTAPGSDLTHWVAQTAYEVPAPYSGTNFTAPDYWDADVFVLQVKQINDVVYIVHPNFPVWKLVRITDSDWTMSEVQFNTPAMLDQNATDATIASSATTGNGATLSVSAPNWATSTYYQPGNVVTGPSPFNSKLYLCAVIHTSGTFTTDVANGYWVEQGYFNSQHVNSYWQLIYNRPASYVSQDITSNTTSSTLQLVGQWEVLTFGTWSADISVQVSYDNGASWQVVATLTSRADANYNIQGQELNGGVYRMVITNWNSTTSATTQRVVLQADNQFIYGLVQITAVTNPYLATATVVVPLYSTDPTQYWAEGAWSDFRGYPQAVTVFQERMWYAGTAYQPQRIWATQTNDIENFALIDQSQDTYGLAFDLNAPQRGPIQWLAAQTDLFAGLAGAEWIITSGAQTAPITPTAILAVEHSANGSSPGTTGVVVSNACFYVQRKGVSFQQMLFSVFTNKYMSQDLQVTSQHLTSARVKQFDYQQQFEEQSLIWAICGDGSLVSMCYAMEQEIFGWSSHNTGAGTDFGFLSVQVIYGDAGQDDEVWVTTQRQGQTTATIERLYPVDWQTNAMGQPQLSAAWYADCAITQTSPGSNVISGIPAILQGRTVCASINTTQAGVNGTFAIQNLVVSNSNTVTIPNYAPITGDVVVVGLPILWQVQPMRLDVDLRAGEIPAIKKALSKIYPRMVNSIGGGWVNAQGKSFGFKVYPITQNSGQPPTYTPNVPFEREVDAAAVSEYKADPVFILQGTDPLPMNLLGVIVEYDIGGKP